MVGYFGIRRYNQYMKSIFFVFLFFMQSLLFAQEDSQLSKATIAAMFPPTLPSDVFDSPLEGFYEVALDTSVAYVSKDGKYIIQGDLYSIDNQENLTDRRRGGIRFNMLNTVDRSKTIIFSPEESVRYRVSIFTDVDCGYCRQFHRDIDQVLAMGIEVEYFFFPRTGPNTESWFKAQSVWCSENQKEALTTAKTTGSIGETSCFGAPVANHFDLGQRMGIRGTPAIFSQDGQELGGYLTPQMLLARLEGITR
jgi:thiol:disulfide interchange protein DsbC